MVTQTIPADNIVNMTPGVVAPAGAALDFTGVFLTNSARVPVGQVYSFGTATAVANFFGGTSSEAAMANIYFLGPDGATVTPGALLFAQYAAAPVAGYVRGGSGLTLAQVQAITSGTLSVTPDGGSVKVSSALNLSTATSFSNAATMIQAAFTTPGFTVTYDSQSGAFVITSSTTGATSSIVVSAGTNASALLLTPATGAVTSPGAIASVPATFMDSLTSVTQNFASFTTVFEPATADCVAFAAWNNGKKSRFIYIMWDTDVNNKAQSPTTTAAALILAAGYNGVRLIYAPINQQNMAAFDACYYASIDFNRLNGRKTLAYRSQTGLLPDVTSGDDYKSLKTNGLDFYGSYATAKQNFVFMSFGTITGKFLWADSYSDQIWLNNNIQLSEIMLLINAGRIPFNTAGDAMVEAGALDPINAALTFGAIATGITLSDLQKSQVNSAAGRDIVNVLQTRGWYLDPAASTASPTVRAARGPIQPVLYYTDGQAVQTINFTSLEVI